MMEIHEYGNPDASIVLIEPIHVPDGMEEEAEMILKLAGLDFHLLAVKVNWFRDLSPWRAPAVSGNISFGDGAEELLEMLYHNSDGDHYYVFKENLSRKTSVVPAIIEWLEGL